MPAADFCGMVRMDCSFLSHDFVTCRRSPEVSSIAFHAQPPDLHSALLMDMGFVAICQLARSPPASNPVLVHQLACLLRASFRPRLATRPLRFAITSRPSRCEEDLHLQAIDHARHTKNAAPFQRRRGQGASSKLGRCFFQRQAQPCSQKAAQDQEQCRWFGGQHSC